MPGNLGELVAGTVGLALRRGYGPDWPAVGPGQSATVEA